MDLKSFFQFNINLGICRSCLSNIIPNYLHREIDKDFISIFTNAFKTERKSQR